MRPSAQAVWTWPSRVHPKRRSAVWTTRTGRAVSAICPLCPATTISWSNTTRITSPAARSPPGSLVRNTLPSLSLETALCVQVLTAVCVSEDNQRRSQVKLGSAADFSLDISETDLSLLTASIQAPSGRDEPCLLKRLANNHIGNSQLYEKFISYPPHSPPLLTASPLSQVSPSSPVRWVNIGSAS